MGKLNWARPRRDTSHLHTPSTGLSAYIPSRPDAEKRWSSAKFEPEERRPPIEAQFAHITDHHRAFIATIANAIRMGRFDAEAVVAHSARAMRPEIQRAGGALQWVMAKAGRRELLDELLRSKKGRGKRIRDNDAIPADPTAPQPASCSR